MKYVACLYRPVVFIYVENSEMFIRRYMRAAFKYLLYDNKITFLSAVIIYYFHSFDLIR